MTPLNTDARRLRATIDGRAAFAMAAVALGAALVALLGRVGAPDRLVGALGPALGLTALATLGVLARSMRVTQFYTAGREQPAPYAALAFAALAAGLFPPFAPPALDATAIGGVALGLAIGLALAALGFGPLLRKTGALSVSDLVAQRFPNVALRVAAVALVGAIGALAALAGAEGAARALVEGTGVSHGAAIALIGAALILIVTPGGLSGVVWAAAGVAVLLLVGLGLPLALSLLGGERPPFPLIGDVGRWGEALQRLDAWRPAAEPLSIDASEIVALTLGLAAFAPLLAPAVATPSRRGAQRAGILGLAWCGALAIVFATAIAAAALALGQATDGVRLEDLPNLLSAASGRGLLTICGASAPNLAAAKAACAASPTFSGALRASDVGTSGEFLLIVSPSLRGFGAAMSGFTSAGLAGAGLALAAAGVHTLGVALGQDFLHRMRDSHAVTSRRLAITRAVMIGAVVVGASLLVLRPLEPAALIGAALALSAATVTPLLLLTLWPRANANDAAIALLASLATGETVLIASGSTSFDHLAKAAILACVAGLAGGIAASLPRKADPMSEGAAFLNGVLHGESDVLSPDKGA